ncbi:PorP/SprF family type IX secretion system membrane protein [Lunatimonas salinarum]|uniref:PorP/SprF family type IX secretion system membrane protein n=1 Tax=Lunatimonas salinarum TaxID=1774590 RepID=UPI001AE0D4AF|nr:type IX secretion system membrane protein PorP/SprF [Lunatimonas salinarum]
MGSSNQIGLIFSCLLRIGSTLLAGFGLIPLSAEGQQIPQFSQYTFNGLHINPAYAGYKLDPFVQATYRSQFMAFPGSPQTFSISGDMASKDGSMGFGATLLSDRLGASSVQSILLTYAYKIKTGDRSYLGLGISGGTSEYSIDGSRLLPDDPTDGTIPMERINLFTPNLNSGLFFHTESFFTGISVFNMIGRQRLENRDLALATHNFHYFFQIGGIFELSPQASLKPSLLVREDLSGPTSYDLNTMVLLDERFWVGVSYRSGWGNRGNRNAIAMLFDLFLSNDLRFGYAYDFNLTATNNYRNNSHEFSLGYYLGDKMRRPGHNYKF